MLTQTNSAGACQRPQRALLPGVLAAAAVLSIGTLLGGGLRGQRVEQVAQTALVQEEVRLQTAQTSLLQGRTFTLLQQYAFAFADAAIRFEDVPKFDISTVYTIAMALPDTVDIADMAFSGRDILLDCRASADAEIARFCARLQADPRFQSVTATPQAPTEGGKLRYTVACVFHVEAGQLMLSAPEE